MFFANVRCLAMEFRRRMLLLVLLLQVLGHVQPFFLPQLPQGHILPPSLEENDRGTLQYSIHIPPQSAYRDHSVHPDILKQLGIDTRNVFHASANYNKQERKIGISDLAFQHRFLDVLYSIHNFSCSSGASAISCIRLPIPQNVRNYMMNSTASVGEFIKYLENVGFVVDTRAAKDLHFCFYNALRVPSIHQAHLVSSLLKRNSVLIVDKDTLAWNPGAVFLPADIHKKVTETLLQSADMNNCFNYLRIKHPVINNESKYAVENIKKIVNETSTKRTTAGYVNGATKSKTEHHYDTTTEFQYLDGLKLTSSKPSETSVPTIEIIEYQQAQLNANQEVPKSSIVITIKYDDTSVETTENTKKNIDETTTENLQFPLEDQQYNTFQSTLKEYETPQESTVAVEIYSVEYDLPVSTTFSTTNELNVAETESDKNSEITTKYPRLTVDSSTQDEILKEYKTSGESTTEFLDLSTETSTYPSRAATESTTSFGKIETEIANVYEVTTDIEHESSEITITTYDTFTAETTSDLYDSTVYKDISHAPRGGNPTLSIDTTTALDESIEDHHDEPYETEINQKIFSVETTSLSINKELHSTGYGLSVETTLIPLEVITVTHDSTIVPTVDHLFVKETTILPEIVKEFASITEASGEENTDLPHTTKEFHEIVRETNTDPIETTTEGMKELEYVLGEEDMKFSTEVTVNTDLTDTFNSISEEHVKELQTSTIEMTTELDHGTDLKDSLFSNDKATVLPNYNRESISTPDMPTIEYEKSFTESTTFIPELVEKKSISKTDESILEHSKISLEITTDIPAMIGFDNIPDEPNPKNPSSIEKTTTSPEFTSEFYNSPQTVVMEYQTSSIQTDVPETFKILYNIADEPTFEYNYLASTETTTNPHEVKDFYSNLHESNQDNPVASVEETTIQQVLNEIHTTPYVATTEFQTFSDETTTIHQVVKSQNNVADDASTENNLFSIETTTDLLETLELHNISHESNLNNDMILAGNRNMQETTVEYATPTDSQPFAIEITTIVPEINNDPKQAGDETGIEQTMSSFDTTLWPEKEERSLNVLRKSRMNHHIYSVETTTDLPQTEVYDISYKTNQEHTTISGDVVTSLSEITTDTADALPISTVDNKIFTFETTVLPEMNDFKSIEHELFNEGPNVANTAQDYDTERSVTSEYDVRQIDISTRTMPNEAITESDITFQGTIGTETDYIEISTVYNKILTETTENYDEMQFEMTSRTNDKTVFEFVDDNPPTSTLEVRLTENFQDVTTEGLRIETTAVDNAPVTSNEYSENTNEYIVPELNDNTYETTTNYDQLDESVTTNIPYQKMFHTSEDTFKQQDFVNVLDTLALERSAVENSSTKSFNENHSESDGENDDKLFPVISFHGDNIQFLDSLIPGDLNQMLENFQTRIMDDNLNLMAKSNQDNSDETESNSDSDRDTSTNNLITTESTEAKPIFNVIRRSVNYLNVPNFNITEGGDSVLFPGQKANISDTSGTNHVLRTMLNDTPALYYEYKKVSELQNVFTEDDAGVTGLSLLNNNQDDSLNTKEKSESDITTEKLEESEVTEFNFVVTTDIPFLSYDNGTADTTEERKLEKAVTLDGENVVDTTISEGIIRRENILEQGSNIPPMNPIAYFEVITAALADNPESTTFSSVDNERNWQTTVFPTRESDGIFTTDAFMELSSTEQESPNQDAQTEVPDLEFLTSVLPSFTTEENKVIDFQLTRDEHILMNKIYRRILSRSNYGDIPQNVEYAGDNNQTPSEDIVSLRTLVPMVVHYVNTENVSEEEIRILRDIFEELWDNFKDQSEVVINFDISSKDNETLEGENNNQIKEKLDLNNTMESSYEKNVKTLDDWAYFKFWKGILNRNVTNGKGNRKDTAVLSGNDTTGIDSNHRTQESTEKETIRAKRMIDDSNFPQYSYDHSTSGRNLFDILSRYGMNQQNEGDDLEKLSNSLASLLGPLEDNSKFSNFNKSTRNILRDRILIDVVKSNRHKVDNNRIRRNSLPFNVVLRIPNKNGMEEDSDQNLNVSDVNKNQFTVYNWTSTHDSTQVANRYAINSSSSITIFINEEASAAPTLNSTSIGNLQLRTNSTKQKSDFHNIFLGEDTSDEVKSENNSNLLHSNKSQLAPDSPTYITTRKIVGDEFVDLNTEDYFYNDTDLGKFLYPGEIVIENVTVQDDANEDYNHIRNKRI